MININELRELSANSHALNDLFISNLIREIENNFASIHHLKFDGINDYSTDYHPNLKEESERKLHGEAVGLCYNLDNIFNDYFKDVAKKGEYKFDGHITLLSDNPNVHMIKSFVNKFNTRQQGLVFLASVLSDYLTHKKLHVNAVDITVSTTQYNLSVKPEIIFRISVDWKREVTYENQQDLTL